MRKRRTLAAAGAAIGLLGTALAAAQASETPGPTRPAIQQETSAPEPVPSPAPGATTTTGTSGDDCQARIDAARAAGETRLVPCLTIPPASGGPATTVPGTGTATRTTWPSPAWCDDHGADGKWWMVRFRSCGIFPADLTVTDPRTGQAVGGLRILNYAYAYSVRDQKTWGYQVALRKSTGWGAVAGTTVSGSAACTGKCRVGEGSFPPQVLRTNKDSLGQWLMDTTLPASPRGKRGTGSGVAAWRLNNPQWAGPSTPVSLRTVNVRCDNALPGSTRIGCALPQYLPEMVYAKSGPYPELAGHIDYAQTTKNLPGRHGTTRFLTRLSDKAKVKANRRKACPDHLPRPPGETCDEYPFASTWQGASTGDGRFSRRMINKVQNSDGGTALGVFYTYNRLLGKDRFLVWIKP